MGRKNVTRFLIIILLALIIGGVFISQVFIRNRGQTSAKPIPSPTGAASTVTKVTNELKQFTSPKYKYSFSYPADWQILDEPNVSGIEIQKIDNHGAGFSISMRIVDNPQKLSVEEFAKNQAFPVASGSSEIPQAVTVGNVTGYKLRYLPKELLVDIFLPYKYKEGGILNIFAGGEFNKGPNTVDFYNQIVKNLLNSFNFL